MTKCLIIDDDPLICDLIKHFCSKLGWTDSCWSVETGNQAIQAMSSQSFDLIFLDYNLPDFTGKELLSFISNDTAVIMITTEEAFGAESYDFPQIIDFLIKPVSLERFMKGIAKYNNRLQEKKEPTKSKNQILVKDGNANVVLKVDEIKYIKSESNYVQFNTTTKKVMSLMRLKQLDNDLPDKFIRIHKSYIVNIDFLESISADDLIIANEKLPIGATYKDALNQKISALF